MRSLVLVIAELTFVSLSAVYFAQADDPSDEVISQGLTLIKSLSQPPRIEAFLNAEALIPSAAIAKMIDFMVHILPLFLLICLSPLSDEAFF